MSDDIPIIFAEDITRTQGKAPATAVFLSAGSALQMQQYAAGGWRVLAAPGFKSPAKIDLAEVPASACGEDDPAGCTLLSCEVKFLGGDAGARIGRWKPEILKFNCAFQDVADAASLAVMAVLCQAGVAVRAIRRGVSLEERFLDAAESAANQRR